ncbi:tetratricopeptide repeat protein [Kurthia gibsonii]|uniref:tetratricopeptide repeat protein n=1 Tax=Kurthia gibsonii TaxID=33946 RepID=UPI002DBC5E9F|nr:tetratricopeptide repeat protein [Kurthia gibsonii]
MEEFNDKQKPKPNIVYFLPSGDFYYQKAQDVMGRGDLGKAAIYLQRAIELSPTDAMIYLQYAVVELEQGNVEKARELLLGADRLEPRNPETVIFLAETSAGLGFLEDALYYANLYLDFDEGGEFTAEAKDILDFAHATLEKIPSEEPNVNRVYIHEQERARQLMEEGHHEQAIEIFEQIIAENPFFWSAYNNLALAYFYQGEEEQARALLREVLHGNYGNLHALCNLTVMAYYAKEDEELVYLESLLIKLHPYKFEHRFKLGATLALIGQYELAYKWLKSLYKNGFSGDGSFYFWLSHSAYFAGDEALSRKVWTQLLEVDPSKEGFEPWVHAIVQEDDLLRDVEYIQSLLQHDERSERLFGLFLLEKSPHKHEILANPTIIKVEEYTAIEKVFLAFVLGRDLEDEAVLKPLFQMVEVAEILYQRVEPMQIEDTFPFQMWFIICENALDQGYAFKNTVALAAAVEYMYRSSRAKVTKKLIAEEYHISPQTLTKYVNELIPFLPLFRP